MIKSFVPMVVHYKRKNNYFANYIEIPLVLSKSLDYSVLSMISFFVSFQTSTLMSVLLV